MIHSLVSVGRDCKIVKLISFFWCLVRGQFQHLLHPLRWASRTTPPFVPLIDEGSSRHDEDEDAHTDYSYIHHLGSSVFSHFSTILNHSKLYCTIDIVFQYVIMLYEFSTIQTPNNMRKFRKNSVSFII